MRKLEFKKGAIVFFFGDCAISFSCSAINFSERFGIVVSDALPGSTSLLVEFEINSRKFRTNIRKSNLFVIAYPNEEEKRKLSTAGLIRRYQEMGTGENSVLRLLLRVLIGKRTEILRKEIEIDMFGKELTLFISAQEIT